VQVVHTVRVRVQEAVVYRVAVAVVVEVEVYLNSAIVCIRTTLE